MSFRNLEKSLPSGMLDPGSNDVSELIFSASLICLPHASQNDPGTFRLQLSIYSSSVPRFQIFREIEDIFFPQILHKCWGLLFHGGSGCIRIPSSYQSLVWAEGYVARIPWQKVEKAEFSKEKLNTIGGKSRV